MVVGERKITMDIDAGYDLLWEDSLYECVDSILGDSFVLQALS